MLTWKKPHSLHARCSFSSSGFFKSSDNNLLRSMTGSCGKESVLDTIGESTSLTTYLFGTMVTPSFDSCFTEGKRREDDSASSVFGSIASQIPMLFRMMLNMNICFWNLKWISQVVYFYFFYFFYWKGWLRLSFPLTMDI